MARKPAESIHETNEQVAKGELERSEEELGHGLTMWLVNRPVATDGQFAQDFELFGSTG